MSCHGGDIIDQQAYHLQLGQNPSKTGMTDLNDLGIYEITGISTDSSRFKVSSLRNIELTAPYLHDGSVSSLSELFNSSHHNFGMNQSEIDELIAFLKTLTDEDILSDEKFSNPFE